MSDNGLVRSVEIITTFRTFGWQWWAATVCAAAFIGYLIGSAS